MLSFLVKDTLPLDRILSTLQSYPLFRSEKLVLVLEENWQEIRGEGLIVAISRFQAGDFSCSVDVLTPISTEIEDLHLAKHFSQIAGTEVLISDESNDPYSWVLVYPNRQAFLVSVRYEEDEKRGDALRLAGPEHPQLGTLLLANPVAESSIKEMVGVLLKEHGIYPIEVESWSFKTHFEMAKEGPDFHAPAFIEAFHHAYSVTDFSQRQYIPNKQQVEFWVSICRQVSFVLNQPVAIWHSSFSHTFNIPGGSDSEEFLLYLDGAAVKKITYKLSRHSW